MPNERVRFPPHADVPAIPDWWPRLFAVRQRKIRAKVVKLLTNHGRLSKSQLSDFCRGAICEKPEFEHCIDIMEADGIVTRKDIVEGVGYKKLNVMKIAYYTLT